MMLQDETCQSLNVMVETRGRRWNLCARLPRADQEQENLESRKKKHYMSLFHERTNSN